MIINLHYADIILLATSEAELKELVYRLVQVSRKYSLLKSTNQHRQNRRNGKQQHSTLHTHSE